MKIQSVGVIGAGTMGNGIAQVCAVAGLDVVMVDINEAAVTRGLEQISKSLDRLVKKETLTPDAKEAALKHIKGSTSYEDFKGLGLVIEAATENQAVKEKILHQVDGIVSKDTIIATNTSSLSITKLAALDSNPARFIGMHFFNPAPVQKFVEVISHAGTAADVTNRVVELAKNLGKSPASIGDQPGFIVNKLLLAYLNHAMNICDRGVAKETIDAAMRELAKFPMGPLELTDLIGLDTCYEIMLTIAADTGNPEHKPAASLTALVQQGNKGRKTGAGYYDYSAKHEAPTSADESGKALVYEELMREYLRSAIEMNDSGYASQADIDLGMKLGCGLPEGPFETLTHFSL